MERRRFTREFKLEAVRLIKERGVSYTQASQDLGLDRYGNSRYGQSWPETGPISLGQRRDQSVLARDGTNLSGRSNEKREALDECLERNGYAPYNEL